MHGWWKPALRATASSADRPICFAGRALRPGFPASWRQPSAGQNRWLDPKPEAQQIVVKNLQELTPWLYD
ncbi:hypothetical protein FIV38_28370 [Pseudomonas proteolytica]|nr:hypothetical protein F4W61_27655 [Pseudomonas proteolytica]QHG25887.1 hypothetical protein GDV60_24680 [Pseudomonas sp. DTU12.1]TWR71648.1 hypothetical protein FIV38_28370 [Pseudomonas proteolytica]